MLYISRYPISITKGKLLKNFNQATEFVWIKNLSALFSLCSHVCVIASICIYGPNILKHQHSYLKSAVLRLCTRNFYLIKILIFIYIYKRQWIDDRIPRSKQATYFFFKSFKALHSSLPVFCGCLFFLFCYQQFIAFTFRVKAKINPKSFMAFLKTAAVVAKMDLEVFFKFVLKN